MSANSDWIPKGHEALHTQANQTAAYLAIAANVTRMGLTGASTWISTEFTSKLTPLNTAFTAWQNPATRTPVLVANLKAAEEAFVPAYRKLYNGFLRFYFALRWENTRGEKGPWSEIGSAVIL